MLITDSAYQLPLVYALKPGHTLASGANRPLLIRGYNEQLATEGDYVVKCIGAERMSVDAFQRELLGCYAAWQIGLHAVEPVQVDISSDFLELLRGRDEYGLVSRSLGLNAGSGFQQGFREFVNGRTLTTAEREQAYLIFAFDVLTCNADRNATKQNMLTDGQRIMLLDHELAFAFTKYIPSTRSPTPWLLTEYDVREWIQKHYFYPQLRGQSFDFATLTPQFQNLDDHFWQAARRHIPPAWQTTELDAIQTYITQVLTHVADFTQELNRITQ